MKITYTLLVFLILSACKNKNHHISNLKYSNRIVNIKNELIPFKISIDSSKILSLLNIDDQNIFKLKIRKLTFENYDFLPFFWQSNYTNNEVAAYWYGFKKINNYRIHLYSENFISDELRRKYISNHYVGLLLLENRGTISSWIKVIDEDIDRAYQLKFKFIEDHIVCIERNSESYDTIDTSKVQYTNYNYVVLRVTNTGYFEILNEIDSEQFLVKNKFDINLLFP